MGGKGSGRKPYYEELEVNKLLAMSISTLIHALKSDSCPTNTKYQIALALASRRVSNKQETKHIVEITSQEQSIIDKYTKPQITVQGMATGGTASEIDLECT